MFSAFFTQAILINQFSETKNVFKALENQHNFANEVTQLDQRNFAFGYKNGKVRPVGEMKSISFFFSFFFFFFSPAEHPQF